MAPHICIETFCRESFMYFFSKRVHAVALMCSIGCEQPCASRIFPLPISSISPSAACLIHITNEFLYGRYAHMVSSMCRSCPRVFFLKTKLLYVSWPFVRMQTLFLKTELLPNDFKELTSCVVV